jgi:glycosyltransferase involved in cell wall biosynthesis
LAERVHETKYLERAEVSRHLQALDVYIDTATAGASTRHTSLAAALAHGLPIAAYRGPETSDLLRTCRALRLVPLGDTQALAEAVAGLIDNASARTEMGECARLLAADHLAWGVLARRHLEVFR